MRLMTNIIIYWKYGIIWSRIKLSDTAEGAVSDSNSRARRYTCGSGVAGFLPKRLFLHLVPSRHPSTVGTKNRHKSDELEGFPKPKRFVLATVSFIVLHSLSSWFWSGSFLASIFFSSACLFQRRSDRVSFIVSFFRCLFVLVCVSFGVWIFQR